MLENKLFKGKHYSRIIASWVKGGGYEQHGFGRYFEEWLRTLEFCEEPICHAYDGKKWVITNKDELHIVKLSDEAINEIVEMADCGISELEHWTSTWLAQNEKRIKSEIAERRKKLREKYSNS